MVERAIRLEGTCTGEHGVGVGKIEYLDEELGKGTVNLMETVKRTRESPVPPLFSFLQWRDPYEMGRNITNAITVDPLNLLNPGKVSRHISAYANCSAVPPYQAYCSHGRAGRACCQAQRCRSRAERGTSYKRNGLRGILAVF